jgi:hypothetical protein
MRRLALVLAAAALLVPAAPASAEEFVIGVLGDSYAAGEASPATPGFYNDDGEKGINPLTTIGRQCIAPGTLIDNRCHDETWWENVPGVTEPQRDDAGWEHDTQRCHRSSIATGPEAARRLAAAIEATYPSVEVVLFDLACSGASIKNLTTTTYEGIDPPLQGDTPQLPAQIGALQDAIGGRRVDAVVMNIGGNDMQFTSWVAACLFLPTSCAGSTLLLSPFRDVVPPFMAAPSPQNEMASDSAGTIDERYSHLARRLRSQARPGGDPREASDQSLAQIPGQVYLTAVPQPLQDENGNLCNGTQTTDRFYKEVKADESLFLRDIVVADINGSIARAATRHGWQLVSEITAAANTRGICSNNSFFRTNIGGLRRQGHDLFPAQTDAINFLLPDSIDLPNLSAGIAHPTDAGYATYGQLVANRLAPQVDFRFRPPGISLLEATTTGFRVQLVDATSTDTGFWQLEVNGQRFDSDAVGSDFSRLGPLQRWQRSGAGEFVVRGRECFKATGYCGPFSAALTVANTVPGAPQNVHRNLPNPSTLRDKSIAVGWDPGVNTTASTTYQVAYRQTFDSCLFRIQNECVGGIPIVSEEQSASTGTLRSFRLGSTSQPLHAGDKWAFRVRACTDAGCGAYSPEVSLPVTEPVTKGTVVGVPGLRLPAGGLRAGHSATVELTWTAPGRWTDLRDVALVLDSRHPRGRPHKRRVGTIRFDEAKRILEVRGARGGVKAGAPDSDVARRLKVRGFAVDLHASGLLRYGPDAHQVTLRIALVPGASLRGRVLTLSVGGRDDRGKRQAPTIAAGLRVR